MSKKKLLSIGIVVVIVAACIAAVVIMGNGAGTTKDGENDDQSSDDDVTDDTSADSGTTSIYLGSDITVDGSSIASNTTSAVYLSSGSGYAMINIVKAGTYTISGSAEDTQIFVNAGDSEEVVLILNDVTLSCSSAPAILIHNAYDPQVAGDSGVTIRLADGTTNVIVGSHSTDNDGAISSDISLSIDGNGSLEVESAFEGIESCEHLTINAGNITVISSEDAINANEDGVSVITINGGTVYADASGSTDGDGIDSNGYIIINGGTVYGFSNGQNSGLDSDLGTIVNGGLVFATALMNDGVSSSSDQTYIDFSFSSTLATGKLVYIVDQSGNPIAAFKTLVSCSSFIYSSSELVSGNTYSVYVGGSVNGTFDEYGLCTSFTVTSAGSLQTNSVNIGK
jgi:hypothetical protein